MAKFRYKASDKSGKPQEVLIEADSQPESLTRLRQKGYTPIKFLGTGDSDSQDSGKHFWLRKAIDPCDFTNRMVPLLVAQIPLERALHIIEEGMDNPRSKNVVSEIRRGLHEGKKFSELIRSRDDCFPGIYANMVEAGEESGALVGVMQELQKFLNESRDLKEFLITSSIYPIIILTVTTGVVILLFTVFVPRFSKIFMDMGKRLPLPTQIMVYVSHAFTDYWWLWLLLIFTLAMVIRQIRKGGKARDLWDEKILKVPVIGKLLQTIEITRFVRTLAVLIQNHVHLLDTIRIAEKVIQNSYILRTLSGVSQELKGGTKLSSALAKSNYIPKTVIRMLNIGEETGNMGTMLDRVAEQFEESVRVQIKRLLSLFEPCVILLLAFVVLGVVLSMFMAILEMNQI